jgi:hypothetical protein
MFEEPSDEKEAKRDCWIIAKEQLLCPIAIFHDSTFPELNVALQKSYWRSSILESSGFHIVRWMCGSMSTSTRLVIEVRTRVMGSVRIELRAWITGRPDILLITQSRDLEWYTECSLNEEGKPCWHLKKTVMSTTDEKVTHADHDLAWYVDCARREAGFIN